MNNNPEYLEPEYLEKDITERARSRGILIAPAMAVIYGLVGIFYMLYPSVTPGWMYSFVALLKIQS